MKSARRIVLALTFGAVAAAALPAFAQAADVSVAPANATPIAAPEAPVGAGEPAVRRTVIEDRGVRIEELRVRGQLQHITVDPKGRAPAYQVLTGEGAPDLADGAGTSRGSAGKRVWNVFRF
jgi:hypothetical protein